MRRLSSCVVFGDRVLRPSYASRRVADATLSIGERLRALGDLTNTRMYPTRTHLTLAHFLLHHASTLHRGTFPVNGTHARAIVGARGIGKTTTLMQLVRGIGAVYPNVVSVYVSYKVRCREEVMVTVARHLVDQGIMSPAAFTHALHTDELIETVQESLIGRELRLLLVVDDVDDLYRVDHAQTPAEGYAAFRTLGSLAALGSWSGGMTAVLLCGSFALPQLLFCGAIRDPGLRQQYPAVVGAPDLNDTKYSLFVLRGGLPTDLSTARIVCGSTTDEKSRQALFHAGGSVRGLEGNTAVAAVSDSDFHRVIMAQLRLENEDVLQSVMDGVRVNHDRVASVPWETQLRPLSWTAVNRLWCKSQDRAGAGSTFMADVVRLANDGHIVWDASKVYPPSLSALVYSCSESEMK